MNSDASEGYAFLTPLVTPVVLFLLHTWRYVINEKKDGIWITTNTNQCVISIKSRLLSNYATKLNSSIATLMAMVFENVL